MKSQFEYDPDTRRFVSSAESRETSGRFGGKGTSDLIFSIVVGAIVGAVACWSVMHLFVKQQTSGGYPAVRSVCVSTGMKEKRTYRWQYEMCPACEGRGRLSSRRCIECGGRGRVRWWYLCPSSND